MPCIATCSRCGDALTTTNAIEVRRQYRSLQGLRRLRTWRERRVCGAGAIDEAGHHDHPHGRGGEKGSLL